MNDCSPIAEVVGWDGGPVGKGMALLGNMAVLLT